MVIEARISPSSSKSILLGGTDVLIYVVPPQPSVLTFTSITSEGVGVAENSSVARNTPIINFYILNIN